MSKLIRSAEWNIKKFKESDKERSGPLTPENGETYDYSKGEPKYYRAYKVGYRHLETLRKKLIEDIDVLDCTNTSKLKKWEIIEKVLSIIDNCFGVKK